MPEDISLLWPPRDTAAPLPAGEVHVWSASLSATDEQLDRLHDWLSPDEQQRAAKIRLEHVRQRFVVSRARQREILAEYLQLRPEQLRFEYGDLGKPRLIAAQASTALHFNLSNSHELALLAVSSDRELGVDVEYLDRRTDGAAIARRFFAPREKQFLQCVPPAERRATFFRCWTRKEAVLKAFGVGLTFPLDRVEVSAAADRTPVLLSLDDRLGPPEHWTLTDLQPADRYVGALAFRDGRATVRCFAWHG